jgi:hypothetical protein
LVTCAVGFVGEQHCAALYDQSADAHQHACAGELQQRPHRTVDDDYDDFQVTHNDNMSFSHRRVSLAGQPQHRRHCSACPRPCCVSCWYLAVCWERSRCSSSSGCCCCCYEETTASPPRQ